MIENLQRARTKKKANIRGIIQRRERSLTTAYEEERSKRGKRDASKQAYRPSHYSSDCRSTTA